MLKILVLTNANWTALGKSMLKILVFKKALKKCVKKFLLKMLKIMC